jgi:AraC-like DNA-binding protein
MLDGIVAAGLMSLACDVAEQHGIARAELLAAAGVAESELDSAAVVPIDAWRRLLRCLLERSGDPAVGARLADAAGVPASEIAALLEGTSLPAEAQAPQRAVEPARRAADPYGEILEQVRDRLDARLEGDASLERIARDLRVSGRTLQRQLGARGASFQQLLEDVRRTRAIAYLTDTDEAVERVAARLGYADPSNFRRAFRRWTGVAPAAFRAENRAR